MTEPLVSHIQQTLATFSAFLATNSSSWLKARSPEAIMALEHEIHQQTRCVADLIVGSLLKSILNQPDFQAQATLAARTDGRPLRDGGARKVTVRLLGGSSFTATVPYLKEDRRQPRRGASASRAVVARVGAVCIQPSPRWGSLSEPPPP